MVLAKDASGNIVMPRAESGQKKRRKKDSSRKDKAGKFDEENEGDGDLEEEENSADLPASGKKRKALATPSRRSSRTKRRSLENVSDTVANDDGLF